MHKFIKNEGIRKERFYFCQYFNNEVKPFLFKSIKSYLLLRVNANRLNPSFHLIQQKKYNNYLYMKRILSIIAFLFLFMGFGMIHAASNIVEKLGSIFIGIGALYFIVLLIMSYRKQNKRA